MTLRELLTERISRDPRRPSRLAIDLGMHPARITQFLRGKDISLNTADRIAAGLGVNVRDTQATTTK